MAIENFIFFGVAGFFLVMSGIYLVRSLDRIAKALNIPEFSLAFILMAFVTSIPELLVGISSAFSKNSALSMGNVIGANIIDLTLIIGIFALIGNGITFKSKKVGKDMYFMFASILILVVLYLIGNSLSRIDGAILLSLFFLNLFRLIKKSRAYSAKVKKDKKKVGKLFNVFVFIVSLLVLFLSSHYIVKYSQEIAIDIGLPEIFIGLFLISFATTLPELVFGINALRLNHKEMSIGDQTGTVFTNICFVLGVVAIIHPITVSLPSFLISGIFMLISGFIVLTFIYSGRKLGIYEGLSLLGLYFFFILVQFLTTAII